MEHNQSDEIMRQLVEAFRRLLPEYLDREADWSKNNGHAAVCIIDEQGRTAGEMFGEDRGKLRIIFQTAVTKATQAWLTGVETGEYERLVYNKQLDYHCFGIPKPEFIGYEGGVPIELRGQKFAIGFSGFRGESDREIIRRAAEQVSGAK